MNEALPWLGMRIIANDWVPATAPFARHDWEDRWAAMTAHHIALDLLPLCDHEPTCFIVHNEIVCHSSVFNILRNYFRAQTSADFIRTAVDSGMGRFTLPA